MTTTTDTQTTDPTMLTEAEVSLLLDALASHVFCHADERYRRSGGEVVAPGSDHAENRAVIAAADALAEKIRGGL